MVFIESGQNFDKESHHNKMKKFMENQDRVKFTIRIPTAILKKFKKKLLDDGLNVNQCLNDMILKYLQE